MNKKLNDGSRTALFAKLAGIVAGITIVVDGLTAVISAPTSAHRAVVREISTLSQSFTGANSARLDQLTRSPEGVYSMISGVVVGLAEMALAIVMLVFLYRHLRHSHLAKESAPLTAGIFTVGTLIALPVSMLFSHWYLGIPLSETSTPEWIGLFATGAIVTFLLSLLVTLVVQSIYNRRHSFEVE